MNSRFKSNSYKYVLRVLEKCRNGRELKIIGDFVIAKSLIQGATMLFEYWIGSRDIFLPLELSISYALW